MGRIDTKITAYNQELESRYPLPFTRYLLGTPRLDRKSAENETIAPKIPPGTYAYPDTVPISIGTILYSDPELTTRLTTDSRKYRHLFTSTGDDAGYILQYDGSGVVSFYEIVP
jgi:hypothetical protein